MRGYPKRLIEVDLPIKRISAHARREKSIRHGHISTLHIWWARRPLAACRAVICAALWPDPADPLCPAAFIDVARKRMSDWSQQNVRLCSAESAAAFLAIHNNPSRLDHPEILRGTLLDFIADFSDWRNSTNPEYLTVARTLTRAASDNCSGTGLQQMLVMDPFAGGATIPLEAMRVGAAAVAGDLNPVAHLIQKLTLSLFPKYGDGLVRDFERVANKVEKDVATQARTLFTGSPSENAPYAWFWARSIRCTGPGCGIKIPIVRQFWLSTQGAPKVAIQYMSGGPGVELRYSIIYPARTSDVQAGTTRRGKVTCPACGLTLKQAQVEAEFLKRGEEPILLAVAEINGSRGGKDYRLPCDADYVALSHARAEYSAMARRGAGELPELPCEEFPYLRSILNPRVYGFRTWGSLFTERQAALAVYFLRSLRNIDYRALSSSSDEEYIQALKIMSAVLFDRQLTFLSSFSRWAPKGEHPVPPFSNNGFPMVWDYVEVNPFAGGSGAWSNNVDWIRRFAQHVLESVSGEAMLAALADAREKLLPDGAADFVFTDPPYYDAVPYANLSDFFFVWLRRLLGSELPALFRGSETPKENEIVQLSERNPIYARKTKQYFEEQMAEAFRCANEQLAQTGLACFVFAHKSTDAWEALLGSVIAANWRVVASWPIDTERASRTRANNAAALGSSIHLVCRKRESSVVGDWREVLEELPPRIAEWLPRLAKEGVVGADAIFACLGPALEIFSRYGQVEKANGDVVTLKEYLEQIWAAVAKEALSLVFEGVDTAGFEPDARLTAMWLWTLNAGASADAGSADDADNGAADDEDSAAKTKLKGGFTLEYDAARKIAQGLGAHLEELSDLVEIKGDQARLLPVSERTKRLFGKEEAQAPTRGRGKKRPVQGDLFADLKEAEQETGWGVAGAPKAGETVLDRIHQSMILFAAGRGEALKRFLVEEGAGRDQRFWSLAQALSALYPNSTDEKRWVDGVLARKKSFGF